MSKLTITEETYPNGEQYFLVRIGHKAIGGGEKVDDGYLANFNRKPVKTIDDAAKQLISRKIKQLENEIKGLNVEWCKLNEKESK